MVSTDNSKLNKNKPTCLAAKELLTLLEPVCDGAAFRNKLSELRIESVEEPEALVESGARVEIFVGQNVWL